MKENDKKKHESSGRLVASLRCPLYVLREVISHLARLGIHAVIQSWEPDGQSVCRWQIKKEELPSSMWQWHSTSFHNLYCQQPLYSRRVVPRIWLAAHMHSLLLHHWRTSTPNHKNTDDILSVHCSWTVEMFGEPCFFVLFFLPALSHQCKGRADYTTGITLPEGERPLIKNESLWLSCAAPLPSCQQETGWWGESFLLWT